MAKSPVKLSVDSEKLAKAKKEIPNLSNFFEECLDLYFNANSDEFELEKISRNIMKANFKREFIIKSKIDQKYIEKDLTQKKNRLWGQLYNNYLHQGEYPWDLMKECIEILGQSEEVLVGMMDALRYDNSSNIDKVKVLKDWDYTVQLFDDVE